MSGNTDALSAFIAAMESQHGHTPAVRSGKLIDQRDEDRFAGFRLRGDCEQGQAVAWRSPEELPDVQHGEYSHFWVAVRRNDRVASYPAVYLNAMPLDRDDLDPIEHAETGNRWRNDPPSEDDECTMLATGWHDSREHSEYDGYFSRLLEEGAELLGWREVAPWPGGDRPQPVAVAVAGDAIEAIAVALWHRFGADDRIEWDDETEKAIYRDAARQVAALSTQPAPSAPDGKVSVREAALRLAIRELNHARQGVESAGRANYVHRLLLAMLGEEPIHDAPAPSEQVAATYSLDADPLRIRERAADAITGALILGSRNTDPPPAGHWLVPFWDMARAEAALRESQVAASVAVPEGWREFIADCAANRNDVYVTPTRCTRAIALLNAAAPVAPALATREGGEAS